MGLFTALATGSHFKGVKLYVRVGGTKTAYLVYEFGLMFITQIQSMNGESGIQEEVQAVFGATQLTYSQQLPTGQLASPQTATWNQVTNTPTLTIPGN